MSLFIFTCKTPNHEELTCRLVNNNVTDGLPYWSRVPVPASRIRYENQRPFIFPRDYETDVSIAVEATSYALMVYLMREGITIIPEKIVQWLTSVRMGSSAFISTMVSTVQIDGHIGWSDILDVNFWMSCLKRTTKSVFWNCSCNLTAKIWAVNLYLI